MKGFDPNDSDPDHALTFDEWSKMGYWIKKGSKAVGFSIDGLALFTPSQVSPPRAASKRTKNKRVTTTSKHETMWEKSANRAKAKGAPWGVVEDFDGFVREAGMLPDLGKRTLFAINDPLERHFMNVADKHGILDRIAFGEDDEY